MDIGKKIKELRTSKLMTQSELAGEEITRNMLSRIENGAALPSLSTITYLAGRLGVPAGFLLAEDNDEFAYRKMNSMKNIKRAYTDKNFDFCRDLCLSELGGTDDEVELILANCCLEIAHECINNGYLHRACRLLDESLHHAGGTIYDTSDIECAVCVTDSFLRKISPMLYSDENELSFEDARVKASACDRRFCRYILALDCIENGNISGIEEGMGEELQNDDYSDLFGMHIRARIKMLEENYTDALELLFGIINSDSIAPKLLVYLCSGDIEICCRETEDYKGAYEYASTRVALAESMLSESII